MMSNLLNDLMLDPNIDIFSHEEIRLSSVQLLLTFNSWTFDERHKLFTTHNSLLHSIIGIMEFGDDEDTAFSIAAIRHFRMNEELFVSYISSIKIGPEKWDQIEHRLPQYTIYKLMMI